MSAHPASKPHLKHLIFSSSTSLSYPLSRPGKFRLFFRCEKICFLVAAPFLLPLALALQPLPQWVGLNIGGLSWHGDEDHGDLDHGDEDHGDEYNTQIFVIADM